MTTAQNIQAEGVDDIAGATPVPPSYSAMLPVIIKYLFRIFSLQRLLFLLSFLTYGVGDGVTAFYMMEKIGVERESNPIMQFMYISYGGEGVIGTKVWFTFVILFIVWLISKGENNYWTINGFLFSLFIGGIMAIRSNMMAANGLEPPSPGFIIMTFLFLAILFMKIGDVLDQVGTAKVKKTQAAG